MSKSAKGFGHRQPVKVTDNAMPPTVDEGTVLSQASKDKLDAVRTFLEAGKAAIAASDSAATLKVSDAVESTADTSKDSTTDEPKPAEQPQSTALSLDKDTLKALLDEAVKSARDSAKAESESEKAELQKQIDELKAEVDKGKDLQSLIQSLEGFRGISEPNTSQDGQVMQPQHLTVKGEGSQESRDYFKLLDSAPTTVVRCKRFGQAKQKDTRAADSYWVRNRDKIRDGLEAQMRSKGLLQGSNRPITEAKDAITLAADIPSIAYEYLSAMMRMTHYEDLIHWQFAKTDIQLGVQPGLTMGMARYDYLARPTAFTDRVLTPGTTIATQSSALAEKIVPITIQELGLGKDSSNPPIGVSTFIDAYSMMNLEDMINRNLGRDYQYTKDLGLRTQWFRTDRVVYNDGGVVTITATDVGNGDEGTMTDAFTVALNAYMYKLQIPSYDDAGNYGLALNPTAAAQFLQSKGSKERDMALESGMDLVSRAIRQTSGFEGGEVSGYLGLYNGFHMFRQNVYGLEGGTEGVNAVTLGTGPVNMLSSFAFGRETIAWGTALPVEIRADDVTDFQRQQRMIWYSHETPASLDVKTTSGTGEQLRVVEVRTAPSAV